jgi:uncharacterized protein (TIGR02594 family)
LLERLIGEIPEQPGIEKNDPFIQWCHQLVGFGSDEPDETPWCSAILNRIFWMCRLPRSKSAMARSWLKVGTPVTLADAQQGDVVVLSRTADAPGPNVLTAPGHVGLFSAYVGDQVHILAGNQGNNVSIASFPISRILGIRRIN